MKEEQEMFSLTNIFCLLGFLFVFLTVVGMSNGWIFIQSFIFGLGKLAFIGFILFMLVGRMAPGMAYSLISDSESVNQEYAYEALVDIANNPEGAYVYEEKADRFFSSLSSVGDYFKNKSFRY